LWLLEEIDADYEFQSMKLEDLKSDWFLAINPNGKSPAMVDGDLKLFESAAICNYIARYEQWQFFYYGRA